MARTNFLFFTLWLFLSVSCQSFSRSTHQPYPEEWWKPVPREEAASWEILPQEASPGEVILSKRNELGILSNFAPTPFLFRGKKYASVEGFWQMLKYPESPEEGWPHTREEVGQMTGFEAKRAGDLASALMKKKNRDWVSFEGKRMKYRENCRCDFFQLIWLAEWEKLKQNPKVEEILLKTGDLVLKPDHHQEPASPPAWHYHKIWMEIRGQLQKRSSAPEIPKPEETKSVSP